jgi:hypothetical protein
MCPEQIGGPAVRSEVWPTGARTVHELPYVVERAVVLAPGPMPEAPGVWLSLLDGTLPQADRGRKQSGVGLSDGGRAKGTAGTS